MRSPRRSVPSASFGGNCANADISGRRPIWPRGWGPGLRRSSGRSPRRMQRLELWASPEPTIARIEAGTVRDQLAETGHDARDSGIALIARLGVAARRYPVLWERDDLVWARRRLEA